MKTEYIPKVVTLLAGAIVCIVCIIQDTYTIYALEALLISLIVFYMIGCIAKRVIEWVIESNRVMKEQLEVVQASERINESDEVSEQGELSEEKKVTEE